MKKCFHRTTRGRKCFLPLLCLIAIVGGCAPSEPTPPAGDNPAMTHEEEHGILPHKPHSFEEAVSEIESRGRALIANSDKPPTQVTEWFDSEPDRTSWGRGSEINRAYSWNAAVRSEPRLICFPPRVTYHTPRSGRNHGFANFGIMNLPTGTTSDEPRGSLRPPSVGAGGGFFCDKDL